MTRKRRKLFGNDRQALDVQIRAAGGRLDRRKVRISALAATFPARIKSELTSPSGLWIAGSTGFLLAEWLHRPTSKAVITDSGAPDSKRHVQNTDKSKLALLLKLFMSVNALWAKANSAGIWSSSSAR